MAEQYDTTDASHRDSGSVLGLAAVAMGVLGSTTAFVPGLWLAGVALGVVALTLGVVAWKQGSRRLAVAGAVAGAVAIVGSLLPSAAPVRREDARPQGPRFLQVGEAIITECTEDERGFLVARGRLVNSADQPGDFLVTIEFESADASTPFGSGQQVARTLQPGHSVPLEVRSSMAPEEPFVCSATGLVLAPPR